MIVSSPLSDWQKILPVHAQEDLHNAGVKRIHQVAGLIESPPGDADFISNQLYVYSVEGPKLSAISRLIVRPEIFGNETQQMLERLGSVPESAVIGTFSFFDIPHAKASRKGWSLKGFNGFITQTDDPNLFKGIFYEISMDTQAATCVFLPSSDDRHYMDGKLSQMSLRDAGASPIWGFEERPITLTGGG